MDFQLKDQYGEDISDIDADILSANGQKSNYRIKVEVTTDGEGTTAAPVVAHTATPVTGLANVTTYYYSNTQFDDFSKGFDFASTTDKVGKTTVKAVIEKSKWHNELLRLLFGCIPYI